jgi:hypothetical protein
MFKELSFCLGFVWFNRGEVRDFNEGEGREAMLIKYMFGSKEKRGGDVRYFN